MALIAPSGRPSLLGFWLVDLQLFGTLLSSPETNLLSLIFLQVLLLDYYRFHDGYCRCSCRSLLGSSAERIDLHLGCRECWAEVREILWFHCRLVVLHGLDDIHGWELPGEFGPSFFPFDLSFFHRQLRTILYPSLLSGRSTSQEELVTITSSGAL